MVEEDDEFANVVVIVFLEFEGGGVNWRGLMVGLLSDGLRA